MHSDFLTFESMTEGRCLVFGSISRFLCPFLECDQRLIHHLEKY
jgi:hypothetical protein